MTFIWLIETETFKITNNKDEDGKPKIINQNFISSHSILKHFIIHNADNALKKE